MYNMTEYDFPAGIDWRHWVQRWDIMQERYLVKRPERFSVIVNMIQSTQGNITQVLDLGCGTGSLMLKILENFPEANVSGIDFDPILLPLARQRLESFGERAKLVLADLREDSWTKLVPHLMDAVVSATALHWFKPQKLTHLYHKIAEVLRPGGIFLNADHVGSEHPGIQKAWQESRERMRAEQANEQADSWESFWEDYTKALGTNAHEINMRVIGQWDGGIEEGLPLAWHFDKLREIGFHSVDCFWRCDCDAIYGGVLKETKAV
jgi:ubiquinone/menaquinone biosynthesis C-methylase UbiE